MMRTMASLAALQTSGIEAKVVLKLQEDSFLMGQVTLSRA